MLLEKRELLAARPLAPSLSPPPRPARIWGPGGRRGRGGSSQQRVCSPFHRLECLVNQPVGLGHGVGQLLGVPSRGLSTGGWRWGVGERGLECPEEGLMPPSKRHEPICWLLGRGMSGGGETTSSNHSPGDGVGRTRDETSLSARAIDKALGTRCMDPRWGLCQGVARTDSRSLPGEWNPWE